MTGTPSGSFARRTAPGRAPARRLTAGWQHGRRPASLADHERRYGPLPGGSDQRRGWPALIEAVAEAGLTGRGGAGYPTAAKMRAVAAHGGAASVIANGMESEPASRKDQALLGMAPHLIMDGAVLAARAVGADVVHICLSRGRPRQVDEIWRAAEERRALGADPVRLLVHDLPARYVASEETSLVSWLNGGEARPANVPPRPSDRGVLDRPTLVDNVETLAHVALIARYGSGWFRAAGDRDAPGTMLVTISGAVGCPGVYEVDAGTRIAELLAMSGALARGYLLLGGYFGSWHRVDEVAHLPFTIAGLRPAGGAPGAGVLCVLPEESCGLAETARVLGYLAGQSAQQCGPCTFGLPAIASDFAQLAAGRPEGDTVARLEQRLSVIPGRGACRHPDGAVRLAASALAAFAADVPGHAAGHPCGAWRRARPGIVLPVPQGQETNGWR
jgi:NADH:ubiquinone oxidoreductase subunit F (NADH-binding)